MCGLCGVLKNVHWTDEGSGRRAQVLRIPLLERVLAHEGLAVRAWDGRMIVADRKGRSAVVDDLTGLWVAAADLLGRPLDPLDPDLVEAL